MPTYSYPSVRPFIEAEFARFPQLDRAHLGRAFALDAVTRANTALAQASCQRDPAAAAATCADAARWRDVLALALAGVEAALVAVHAALDLPVPGFARQPEPIPAPAPIPPVKSKGK